MLNPLYHCNLLPKADILPIALPALCPLFMILNVVLRNRQKKREGGCCRTVRSRGVARDATPPLPVRARSLARDRSLLPAFWVMSSAFTAHVAHGALLLPVTMPPQAWHGCCGVRLRAPRAFARARVRRGGAAAAALNVVLLPLPFARAPFPPALYRARNAAFLRDGDVALFGVGYRCSLPRARDDAAHAARFPTYLLVVPFLYLIRLISTSDRLHIVGRRRLRRA